ncbi:MAG: amidohydrolase family protein [Burkholderiales bacterium]
MSDSRATPESELRRGVLGAVAMAGIVPLLGGCDWIKGLFNPKPAPKSLAPASAVVDLHCHSFNIRDMPAYAFLVDVVVENPALRPVAAPFARLLVEVCRAPAKTAEDEKAVLTAILANPSGPRPAVITIADITAMLATGIDGYLKRYSSLNGLLNPLAPSTIDADQMILTLFDAFLPGVVDKGKSVAQNGPAIAMATPQLIAKLTTAPAAQGVPFNQYAAQFLTKWAPEIAKYRFQIADDAGAIFNGVTPVFLAPATLDITNWLPEAKQDEPPTPLPLQAEVMKLMSLIQPANQALHGFIGFDPWRQVVDEQSGTHPTALEIVQAAIESQGFVGVKVYPPMGFQAIGNASLPDSEFATLLPATITGRGARIDAALMKLYDYCNSNEVPILAHCAASQGPSPQAAARAHPQHWKTLLDANPALKGTLRVCLGHFGGLWNFDGGSATCWTPDVAALLQSGQYPFLYTDLGDFSNILNRDPSDKTTLILQNVKQLLDANPKVRERIMYGTDFHLLGREPSYEKYYTQTIAQMLPALGTPNLDGFMHANAARFLGLEPGRKTRMRLEKFYVDNAQSPAKLAQFA